MRPSIIIVTGPHCTHHKYLSSYDRGVTTSASALSPLLDFVRRCPLDLRVEDLPPRARENVLIPVVPAPAHDLARVTLVLFNSCITHQTNVIMNIEMEKWARLSSRLGDDQIVEGVRVRNNQVLFHIHELVHAASLQLSTEILLAKLLAGFLQELSNGCAFLQSDAAPVPGPVPI